MSRFEADKARAEKDKITKDRRRKAEARARSNTDMKVTGLDTQACGTGRTYDTHYIARTARTRAYNTFTYTAHTRIHHRRASNVYAHTIHTRAVYTATGLATKRRW